MAKWQVDESQYPADFKFLYVSKDGSNANAGTQAAPLLEINAAILKAQADANYLIGKVVIVIGSGLWAETLSTTRTKQYRFIGDGEVVFDGLQANIIRLRENEYLSNVIIQGYQNKAITQAITSNCSITFSNIRSFDESDIATSANTTITVNLIIDKCIFKDVMQFGAQNNINYVNLFCTNSIFRFIATYVSAVGGIWRINTFINNKFDGFKQAHTSSAYDPTYTGPINYNNCVLDIIQVRAINGSWITYMKSLNHEQNSFSAPPKFTNETIGDYTYQPDSPCLRRGKDGANIGVYGRGYAYPPTAAEWLKANGATFSQSYVGGVLDDDIELNIDSFWSFKTGHKTGWVKSAIIDLGSDVKLSRANLKATMGFDAFTGKLNKTVDFECQDFGTYVNTKKYYRGDTCNVSGTKYKCILDYPDETPFVEYPPASSPTYWGVMSTVVETSFQIDFEMRYGFTLTEINAASYKKILYNNPVKVDTSGYGNADDNFNIELAETITTRFIQLIVKLKDLT